MEFRHKILFDLERLRVSPFPGPRAYAIAHRILHYGEAREALKQIINSTEGIKGLPATTSITPNESEND